MENLNKKHEDDTGLNLPGNYAHEKKNIFQTPANYFEKLPLDVADKINQGNSNGVVHSPSVSSIKSRIVMALVACSIIGSLYYFSINDKGLKTKSVISSDDLINTEMVSEFDESMLVDAYVKLASSNSNTKSEGTSSTTSNKSNDALQKSDSKVLENYLIENNIDITLIINEL